MKSVSVIEKKKELEYPCLMEGDTSGAIVLFQRIGVGTVVGNRKRDPDWEIGNFSACWAMDGFTPFTGKIILSNED